MKTKTRINVLAFIGAVILSSFVLTISAQCQDIDPQDAAAIRKLIAENQRLKAENLELINQRDAWKGHAASWEALYQAEKDRADRVQGGRIEQLNIALAAEKESVRLLRDQVKADQQYIERLEKRVSNLKTQRWIFGLGGFAAGTYFGAKVQF